MYAIVKSGGKQLKVAVGETVRVEALNKDGAKLDKGAKVTLGEVLMLVDGDKTSIGAPLLAGASVAAEVVEHVRNDKIIVFKKQRRQNHRRKHGHRQHVTLLKVTGISAGK